MGNEVMSAGQLLKQANQLKRAGRLDEAIALYHQVIEINPNFAWAYNNLGDAFVKQRKFSDAISVFERAIQISPKTASYYYSLGKIFVEEDNLDEAVNRFQQAIEIKPNFNLAKQALEKLYNKQQENSRLWELTFKTAEISNLFSPFNFEGNWEVRECAAGIYGLFSREIGNNFTIPVEASKVILVFHRHSWSGKVRASVGMESLTVDLYSNTPQYNYQLEFNIKSNFSSSIKIETIEGKNENSLGNECWFLGILFDRDQPWASNPNNLLSFVYQNLELEKCLTYGQSFYQEIELGSKSSAAKIVPLILELVDPSSVVDVGCGTGSWLSTFQEHGIEDIFGIDGDWVDAKMLTIPRQKFLSINLKEPIEINKKFDLVVSLEVAEHLPEEFADRFITSLIGLGEVILFSAAIPFQGGVEHINEQWPDYWIEKFTARGYVVIDCIREQVWDDESVEWWYSQNIFVFVKHRRIKHFPKLLAEFGKARLLPISIVHPRNYFWQCQSRVQT